MFYFLPGLVYSGLLNNLSSPIIYYSHTFPFNEQICTHIPLTLQIHSKYHKMISNYSWNINFPHKCDILSNNFNKSNNFSFTMSCKEAQRIQVNLSIILKESFDTISFPFYFQIHNCYENRWHSYIKQTTNSDHTINSQIQKSNNNILQLNNEEQLKIRIWPLSYLSSSFEENNNIAGSPSKTSVEISKKINSLGFIPKLKILTNDGNELTNYSLSELHFNSKKYYWTTTLTFSTKDSLNAYIFSDSFLVTNQSIQSSVDCVYPHFFEFETLLARANLLNRHSESDFNSNSQFQNIGYNEKVITRIPGSPHYALIHIKPDYIATTTNNFNSVQYFNILPVDSLVFTSDGLLFLNATNSGSNLLTLIPFSHMDKINNHFNSSNIVLIYSNEDKLLNQVLSSSYYTRLLTENEIIPHANRYVIFYLKANASNSNYESYSSYFKLSLDGGRNFDRIDLPVEYRDKIRFYNAELVITGKGSVHFICGMNDNENQEQFFVLTYFFGTNEFKRSHNFDDKTPELSIKSNELGYIYVFHHDIFVSTDLSRSFEKLSIVSYKSFKKDNIKTKIMNLEFLSNGHFIAVFESGELFLGRIDQQKIIQLQISCDNNSFISYDSLNRFNVIKLADNQFSVEKYIINLENEIFAFQYHFPNEINSKCPIISHLVNFTSSNQLYLDKHSNAIITSKVTSISGLNSLIHINSQINSSVSLETIKNPFFDKNSNFQVLLTKKATIDLSGVNEGLSHLFISADGSTFSCPNSIKVLPIYIGCPHGRNLRVKSSTPSRLFYSQTRFKPDLAIYDGDSYIKDVTADYFVKLISQDHDFKIRYCLKARRAGCIIKPQSFESMNYTWNKDNYKSCFQEDKSQNENDIYDPNTYYEVLNSTDNCLILYPKNAKYVFEVTVLDPDFSYCHLVTQFTLEIWGEPMTIWLSISVIVTTLGISLSFIFIYYLYQNHKYKKEINQKKDKSISTNLSKVHND